MKLTTSELSAKTGVSTRLIRKWRDRGHLKLAPRGQHGQGRGNELLWTLSAQKELIEFAAAKR